MRARISINQQQGGMNNALGLATFKPTLSEIRRKKILGRIFAVSADLQEFLQKMISYVLKP